MRIAHLFGLQPASAPSKHSLKGTLRIVNKIFTDNTGPRKVFFASYFPALRIMRDDPARFAKEFDSIAAAGYQGVRVFWAVGGFHGFWGGNEVVPVSFTQDDGTRLDAWSDYDDLFIKLLAESKRRGLRLALTTGDIEYIMPDPDVELAQHKRIAHLVATNGGADIVSSWEVRNEWYVNSPRGSDEVNITQMRRVASAVKTILPDVLVSTSNINASQDPPQFVTMARGADLVHVHGMRSPGERAIDRAMHCVAWGEGNNQYRPYPVWQMEPASAICAIGGCTDPILDHPELLALYAMHHITGQPSTFFQGNGVIPGAPLASVWGFKELPAIFNKYIPDDIATWDHGFHHVGSILWWFNATKAITVVAEGWDYTPTVTLKSSTVIIGDNTFNQVIDLSSVLKPGFGAALIIGDR